MPCPLPYQLAYIALSACCCAGFTPNGELARLGLGNKFVATWPQEQLCLLRQAEFSSTVREVLAPRLLLQGLVQHAPQLVQGRRVQYQGDSQPATAVINGQSGNPLVWQEVRQLIELCKQHDIELEAVWFPRTAVLQRLADALSKIVDTTQIKLGQAAWQLVCSQLQLLPGLSGRTIT